MRPMVGSPVRTRLVFGIGAVFNPYLDAVFRDSHALLVQHASGTVAQIDLRHSHRPIDAVPRVAMSWNAVDGSDGALAFVADKRGKWEVPYDDVYVGVVFFSYAAHGFSLIVIPTGARWSPTASRESRPWATSVGYLVYRTWGCMYAPLPLKTLGRMNSRDLPRVMSCPTSRPRGRTFAL